MEKKPAMWSDRGMKTINAIINQASAAPWSSWLRALEQAGHAINRVDAATVETEAWYELEGDTMLLDGMVPRLGTLILLLHDRFPDMKIIVATEYGSFSVYYEVQHLGKATYISGPMSKREFVEAVRRLTGRAEVLA